MTGSMAKQVHMQVLRNLTLSPECWGREAGRKIQQVLINRIMATPPSDDWRLSLQGVIRLDVTFASEALAAVVQHFLGERHICLTEPANEDAVTNITAAAERLHVPVTLWRGTSAQVLGPKPGAGAVDALVFALGRQQTFARDLAAAQALSITNASTRLRYLWERGYLRREEVHAASGGTEFVYAPIG